MWHGHQRSSSERLPSNHSNLLQGDTLACQALTTSSIATRDPTDLRDQVRDLCLCYKSIDATKMMNSAYLLDKCGE